jgi:hypothetical protein
MAMERPRRVSKKPLTYWEEYVATDQWYLNALLEDIPENELAAACVDDDFSGTEAEVEEHEDEYETQGDDESLSSDIEDSDGVASDSETEV